MRSSLALATVLIALACAEGAGAAEPARVSGAITKLPPKPDAGRTVRVVAIHLPDAQVVDGDRADGGHYALEVPKGVNVLMTQVIPASGARSTSVLAAAIKVKSGERRKLKLSAKKRKRRHGGHHHRRTLAARGARVVAEDGRTYPGESFAFRQFTGATGKWGFANGGLPDMFTTDMFQAPPGCPYTLVERRRFDTIENELALSESGLVDPEHAIRRGHLIPVELWIEGELSNAFDPPAPLRYKIRIVEAATGKVRTTLEGLLGGDGTFFADQAALWQRLRAAICAPPPACRAAESCGPSDPPPPVGSPHYSGPVTGRYTADVGGPTPVTIDWTGNVGFTLTGETSSPPFGLPQPGPYALYEVTSGSLHFTFNYQESGCTWAGATDLALTPAGHYGTLYAQEGVATPAYQLGIASGATPDTVPFTRSGPAPGCTGTGSWPLLGIGYARTPTPQTSPSSVIVGSATYSPGPGQTENYNWNLTPGP